MDLATQPASQPISKVNTINKIKGERVRNLGPTTNGSSLGLPGHPLTLP